MGQRDELITLYSYYELGVTVAQLTIQVGLQREHPYFRQNPLGDSIKEFVNMISSKLKTLGIDHIINVESITTETADSFASEIGDAFVEPGRYEKKYAYTLGQNMILWALENIAILGNTQEAKMTNLQREILLALKALNIKDESVEQFFEEVNEYNSVEDYENGIKYFSRMIEVFLSKITISTRESIKRKKKFVHDDNYDYDVAFSFASEDRDYVGKVAKYLIERGISVFYDEYEEVKIWGKDLYTYLDDIYTNCSKYCVVFVSKSYTENMWTCHELKSIFVRAFSSKNEYILPARFDDTAIEGIRETLKCIDLRMHSPNEFADIVIEKLRQDYKMQ